MISVAQALDSLFALVTPLDTETVPLTQAAGRMLARDVSATRPQPPFAASAMDGYAVPDATPAPGQSWAVAGESAAGHSFAGAVSAGQAIRIFTGAPIPDGTARVIIQEDVARDGDIIRVTADLSANTNIRPAAGDFDVGATLSAPRVLSPADIALLASMNVPQVPVTRRPKVALIATGDELAVPGSQPGTDQIMASNSYGLHALLAQLGAAPRLLPIAADTLSSLALAFELAADADLILTIGGASVGDHDLVGPAAERAGMERAFYKVAMRPGKPLMAGRLGASALIGLPGNPVSAMVCGQIFVAPVITAMLGGAAVPAQRRHAPLAAPLAANGPREHYLRARLTPEGVTAYDKQDSSLLTVLSDANCLIVQPPDDPGRTTGDMVEVITI